MKLNELSGATLRRAADIKERIEALNGELDGIGGGLTSTYLNQEEVAKILMNETEKFATQFPGRWKRNADGSISPKVKKQKRTMSAVARAKISAAAKRRWRRVRAGKA